MKKKQVNVKGKRITYYESRDNGKTIVFVHGFSSCSSIFIRQLIDSVLSYQFRIIAVDLIGHGNAEVSDNPDTDYSLNGLSEFLADFCKTLEIKDAVFAGHNNGGNVILEAFEKLNNPTGLVLLSSIPFSKPFSKDIFVDQEFIELFSKAGVDDSDVHQMASWFVEKGTSYPEFIPEIIRKADLKTRDVFFKSALNGEYTDQCKKLEEIDIPVAVYIGEHDQIFKKESLNTLNFKNLWRSSIQEIKEAGHIFFYENPADFNVSFEVYLNTVFK